MEKQIVGVANSKGGTGKSTIAIHLACCALETGVNVSLVDTDAQGSVKDWANVRPDSMETPNVVCNNDPYSIHVTIERLEDELIVVDSPAGLSEITGEVLGLSDLVLVPIMPSVLDLWGVGEFERVLEEQAQEGLEVVLVTSKYDHASTLSEELAEYLSEEYPEYSHLEYGICDRVAYKRQMGQGQTVLEGNDARAKNEVRRLYHDINDLLHE
ncbi:ParA family protein [Salinibacter ruber]|jgi:chromosome partitioning protein|uniref:Chromosome partitioning protein n=1 Tax=Salinibacter ruber TaxID=146919 RepID=A0A9X3A092_9BACT|nr:ParA family protein [Salinibacter ruber]MCS3616881.1 chromosome partitioning protein [Salinibacter ruber]MCS4038277.1 chromosome partitioning protein [Salinibacter ruber]